jgi:hypothetical protein
MLEIPCPPVRYVDALNTSVTVTAAACVFGTRKSVRAVDNAVLYVAAIELVNVTPLTAVLVGLVALAFPFITTRAYTIELMVM